MWKCKCSCGNEKTIVGSRLIQKQVVSCGCKMKEVGKQNGRNNKKDILNQRFGKLIVIAETNQRDNDGSIIWKCKCDCGNIHYCSGTLLRTHKVQSCGCINYSIGEKNIETLLKNNSLSYKKEYAVKELQYQRFDFAILENDIPIRLIEYDGEQHFGKSRIKEWEERCPFQERQKRDQMKNEWAKKHNIPLVRIPYWERDKITLDMILKDEYLVSDFKEMEGVESNEFPQ